MQIWKFPIPRPYEQKFTVMMPQGSQPLCMREQRGVLCMWALVDPERPSIPRHFHILMTGEEFSHFNKYVDTVQMTAPCGGELVLHLYELGEDRAALRELGEKGLL